MRSFIHFKFWDGKQNFVSNLWQIVLANIFIQGRVVDSHVYCFFIALAILCPSLPIIWKFSTAVWPVVFWCSKIGKMHSNVLYISPNVLADSPYTFTITISLAKLNQYMILFYFVIVSLSSEDITDCDDEYIGESARTLWERYKEHLKCA